MKKQHRWQKNSLGMDYDFYRLRIPWFCGCVGSITGCGIIDFFFSRDAPDTKKSSTGKGVWTMAPKLDTGVKSLDLSTKQWFYEGARRYGPDKDNWKLKCPRCNRVHKTSDYLKNTAFMAFQDCVECGHRGKMVNNPITIHLERGLSDNIFDFADEPLCS